jgi:hypothetical protein
MLAEDVDKVGGKARAEDRVGIGITEHGQTVLVLIVSQIKIVTEA